MHKDFSSDESAVLLLRTLRCLSLDYPCDCKRNEAIKKLDGDVRLYLTLLYKFSPSEIQAVLNGFKLGGF
jgi:hypothetical protein